MAPIDYLVKAILAVLMLVMKFISLGLKTVTRGLPPERNASGERLMMVTREEKKDPRGIPRAVHMQAGAHRADARQDDDIGHEGKRSSPSNEDPSIAANRIGVDRAICKPVQETPWIRRLSTANLCGTAICHICGSRARAKCRGCNRGLCVSCARSRTECHDS